MLLITLGTLRMKGNASHITHCPFRTRAIIRRLQSAHIDELFSNSLDCTGVYVRVCVWRADEESTGNL